MIAKLDNMVEAGSGDEQYKNLFHTTMINFCEKHTVMRDQVSCEGKRMFIFICRE